MKRFTSILLIMTVIMSVFVVGDVSASAASKSESVTVTQAYMGKNGAVTVKWKALSYCKYYRVFYKFDNASWVKAADVHFLAQGRYYPGQTMTKSFNVPLYKMKSGNANDVRKVYVTVRGMNRDKKFITSYRTYLAYFGQLKYLAPRMYLQNLDGNKATFVIGDPQFISTSTKFRIYYFQGYRWKSIGDFSKNNFRNRYAIATLYVPLYKYNNKARFSVVGINNKGQYTTPTLNDAVVENYPDIMTYKLYRLIAG